MDGSTRDRTLYPFWAALAASRMVSVVHTPADHVSVRPSDRPSVRVDQRGRLTSVDGRLVHTNDYGLP